MVAGIYKIENIINEKHYIGSTNDIECRWGAHINSLRSNKHTNRHLQFAWNRYGEENFKFSVIERCCPIREMLFEREQFYLDALNACDRGVGYNMCPIAGSPSEIKYGKNNHRSKFITFDGKTLNINQWAEETGIRCRCIAKRLRHGWSIERALTTTPVKDGKEKLITFEGKILNLSEWSNYLGISNATLDYRLKNWTIEKALSKDTPCKSLPKSITLNGKTQNLKDWAKEIGMNYSTLKYRIKLGWSIEKALTPPVKAH